MIYRGWLIWQSDVLGFYAKQEGKKIWGLRVRDLFNKIDERELQAGLKEAFDKIEKQN